MRRECPQCGEFMRLVVRENVQHVPGSSQQIRSKEREWVCPECEYFEEDESPETRDE